MEIAYSTQNLNFRSRINVILSDPAMKSFPLHCHKYMEILAIPTSAKNKQPYLVRVNQALYELEGGDILLIWPGELHEIVDSGNNTFLGVQFARTLIQEIPEFASYINLFRTFQFIKYKEQPELASLFMKHLTAMTKAKWEQQAFHETKSIISLMEMTMDFANYIGQNSKSTTNHPRVIKAMEKISDACSYITEHCQQELPLEKVADYVGFHPCYFSRIFKEATGYSYIEYLTMQRVNAAQLLLVDTRMNITEVAYQSGFKSISTFNRVFKQYRGCNPTEYRNYYDS